VLVRKLVRAFGYDFEMLLNYRTQFRYWRGISPRLAETEVGAVDLEELVI